MWHVRSGLFQGKLLSLFLTACLVLSASLSFAGESDQNLGECGKNFAALANSDKYSWLENATEARTRWIRRQNRDVNLKLKKSKNKKPIQNWLRKIYDREVILQQHDLNDRETLK